MTTLHYLCLNHANDFAQSVEAETYHPMVSVVHFDELGPIAHTLNKMGDVYAFFVQDNFPEDGKYGMGNYDTSKGSLVAVSPGQISAKLTTVHARCITGGRCTSRRSSCAARHSSNGCTTITIFRIT